MNSSKPIFNPESSHPHQSVSSEKKRKEFLDSKLKEIHKKSKSSASLFWDWRKDIKDTPHPPKEMK